MTSDQLFDILIRGSYLLLAVLTLAGLIRRRDSAHLDIALPFNALGISILISAIQSATGFKPVWLSTLSALMLLTQPYLFLRLLKHFRRVPALLERATLAGLVLAGIAIIIQPKPSPLISVLIVLYFVAAELYTVVAFIRGAMRTRGVSRWQLSLVAGGSGLLALIIILAGLGSLLPRVLPVDPAVRVGAVLAALSYYLGFSSPRWLRRAWQDAELRDFVHGIAEIDQPEAAMTFLCDSAVRAVGGDLAVVGLWNELRGQMVLNETSDEAELHHLTVSGDDVVGRAWRGQKPMMSTGPDDFGPEMGERAQETGSKALYVVPIGFSGQKIGLLLVLLHGALFSDDDLDLLALLAWQKGRTLRYTTLIEDLRYQARLLASVSDVIVSADINQNVKSWNKAAEATYGWKEAEAIGKHSPTLLDSRFVSDSKEAAMELMGRQGSYTGEFIHRHKDGHDVHILGSMSVVHDVNDTAIGFILVGRDITDRIKIEEALRHERDLMQALMDNIPYMIYFKDEQSRFLRVNRAQARFLGAESPESVVGKSDLDFQRVDITMDSLKEERRIIASGEPSIDRIEFNPQADGTPRWVASTKAPIRDADGGIHWLVGVSRDVTEMVLAEHKINELNLSLFEHSAQLELANKELEAFSYSVSHDLRAPLRSIDGFSKLLLEDYREAIPEKAAHYLQRVRDNSQKMGLLIDDLLVFSRLSRQPLSKQHVELQGLVQRALDDLREEYAGREVEIVVGELPDCEGDPALLTQVFANLLGNALKYSRKRERARVEVGYLRQNGTSAYYVRDNGVGFNMKYSDKLFGVFQRLHRAEDYEGTGVGLATVQRIISRHGGRIWAEAELDKGATFYFTLQSGGEQHDVQPGGDPAD